MKSSGMKKRKGATVVVDGATLTKLQTEAIECALAEPEVLMLMMLLGAITATPSRAKLLESISREVLPRLVAMLNEIE